MTGTSVLHAVITNSPDLMPSTRNRYLRDLNAWIEWAGGQPQDWTRAKAQAFYAHLLTKMRPQSANRLMSSVQYASKWWAHSANNPALDFAAVRKAKGKDKQPRNTLTDEAAIKLLETCATDSPLDVRDFAILVTFLETGMRVMSSIGMTIEGTITALPTAIREPDGSPITHPTALVPMKGHSEVVAVPLSDTAIAAILPWRAWLASARIRDGMMFRPLTRRMGTTGANVYMPQGHGISKSAMWKIIVGRGELAGIEHVHPHMFRHTFITWRINAGLQPHEIAAVTGHKLGLGALGNYIDMQAVGKRIRESTPPWLSELVARRRRGSP